MAGQLGPYRIRYAFAGVHPWIARRNLGHGLGQPILEAIVVANAGDLSVSDLEKGASRNPECLSRGRQGSLRGIAVTAENGKLHGRPGAVFVTHDFDVEDVLLAKSAHTLYESRVGYPAKLAPSLADIMDDVMAEQSQEGIGVLGVERGVVAVEQNLGFCLHDGKVPSDPSRGYGALC